MSERISVSHDAVSAPWALAHMPKQTPVLLALSGGADSRALLHLLAEQSKRDGFPLYAAHLHHGIRGADADRDAAFCEALARAYGCEFFLRRVDIPRLAAESGLSEETEAREARYAFFAELMEKHSIPILATAHHADDNLETVLFRLSRGSGLRGLCGISEARDFSIGQLVRPLLPFSRREIRAYCEKEGLDFVQDATNDEPICSRNRIRLEAVPVLEAIAGDPQRSVFRMTRSLARDRDYLETEARKFLEANTTSRGVPIAQLRELHPAIRFRVLSALSPREPEAVHLEAMDALVTCGRSGSSTPLPCRFVACVQDGFLTVLPDLRKKKTDLPLPFGDQTIALCDGKLTVCVSKPENFCETSNVHNLSTHKCIIIERAYLDPDGLYWRYRREGDELACDARRERLSKLYKNAAVPPMLRDCIPVLCRGDEIVWAPFVGFCRDAEALDGTGEKIQIEVFLLCKDLKEG